MPTGQAVYLKDADGNTIKSSTNGNLYTNETFSIVKNPPRLAITSDSGGTQLNSIPAGKVFLRSFSGNNTLYVGGNGDDAPYSGHGMELFTNETMWVPVDNSNKVQICAANSGDFVRYQVYMNADNVALDNTGEPADRDSVRPTVVTTVPASGVSGVSRTADILGIFSENIASGTVNTTTFTVNNGSINLSGNVYLSPTSGGVAVFTPLVNLNSGTVHTLTLTSGITDLAGNSMASNYTSTFTAIGAAVGADTTPPTVASTTPVNMAEGVSTASTIKIIFSEQMLSSTIISSNFQLKTSTNSIVGGTVSLNSTDKKTVTFTPSGLNSAEVYTMTVSTGVQDLAGNNMAASYSFYFTTTYTYTQIYTLTDNGGTNNLFNGDDVRDGIMIDGGGVIKGQVPKKVRAKLAKSNSSTSGPIYAVLRDKNDIVRTTFGLTAFGSGMNASSLTTTLTNYDFTNVKATYIAASGDKILVEFSGGTSSNYVIMSRNTTSSTSDGRRTHWKVVGGYQTESTQEFAGTIWR